MNRWLRRLRRALVVRRPTTPTWPELGHVPAPDPADDARAALAGLTITQLSALWRKSRSGLTAAETSVEACAVVTARAALLAELERRDPRAMAEWLAAGGAEPEGPPAYLLGAAWHGTGEH